MTVTLVPVSPAQARAVVAGDLSGIAAARGWPHADTVDALRPVAASDDGTGTFLVVHDGLVVGECGWFGPPGEAGEVEIGYGLAAPSRGRGLGGAAVRALVEWVGAQPGVRLVVAHTDPANTASRRLLERLGFTLDGLRDRNVRYVLSAGQAG